jgi:hypothetical protein
MNLAAPTSLKALDWSILNSLILSKLILVELLTQWALLLALAKNVVIETLI